MNAKPITNTAFPLSWPAGKPRTPAHRRQRSKFDVSSFAVVRDNLLTELRRLGAKQIVLSTNVETRGDGLPYANRRQPDDAGAAVFFVDRKGRQLAFACDRWDKIEDNLRAIEKTIEALRGVERWGSGDMLEAAFTGFLALPAAATRRWFDVFNVPAHTPTNEVSDAYRRALMVAHPQRGGSNEAFHEVEQAWREFKAERGLN